jgi:hypothetical protein
MTSDQERAAAREAKNFRRDFRVLKTRMDEKGKRAVDRRTTEGRALARWRAELIRDLGGEENLSTQRKALVELVCRDRFLLDAVDGWLLSQPTFINRRRRCLFPIVVEREKLADSLARRLAQLGLEKFEPKAINVLEQHLASQGLQLAKAERKHNESAEENSDDCRSAE